MCVYTGSRVCMLWVALLGGSVLSTSQMLVRMETGMLRGGEWPETMES